MILQILEYNLNNTIYYRVHTSWSLITEWSNNDNCLVITWSILYWNEKFELIYVHWILGAITVLSLIASVEHETYTSDQIKSCSLIWMPTMIINYAEWTTETEEIWPVLCPTAWCNFDDSTFLITIIHDPLNIKQLGVRVLCFVWLNDNLLYHTNDVHLFQ